MKARGFTLIEVLVALAIVAVTLAAGIKAAGALMNNAERDQKWIAPAKAMVEPRVALANWMAEIARFAPSLKAIVAHPSATPAEKLTTDGADILADVDLVITSYGFLARLWRRASKPRADSPATTNSTPTTPSHPKSISGAEGWTRET